MRWREFAREAATPQQKQAQAADTAADHAMDAAKRQKAQAKLLRKRADASKAQADFQKTISNTRG